MTRRGRPRNLPSNIQQRPIRYIYNDTNGDTTTTTTWPSWDRAGQGKVGTDGTGGRYGRAGCGYMYMQHTNLALSPSSLSLLCFLSLSISTDTTQGKSHLLKATRRGERHRGREERGGKKPRREPQRKKERKQHLGNGVLYPSIHKGREEGTTWFSVQKTRDQPRNPPSVWFYCQLNSVYCA